jgi:N-dimethylarginine dimethylaminohydrolase
MKHTAHSDIGKIKTLFIKEADQAFTSESHIEQFWKELNYLAKPDFSRALAEYASFQSILKNQGAEIFRFPEDASVNMDSVYCRDASIATNGGMIICNMGKLARTNETHAAKKAFEANGIPVLGVITAPGTLEGGDVCWLDEHTLAVGHTYRTNEEGIRQLAAMLQPLKVEIITVPLPHYKGPADVFHLMSILSPVDSDLAVVYSPLMPISFRNLLLRRGYELLEVPDHEFETMGCNVLALAPRDCLIVDGNPSTKTALENSGCKVTVYKGEEISVKGGGGPTCLTRPIYRYTGVL